MTIARLEDKLKLAEELDLEVQHLYKQEVELSLGLTFKRTNRDEIEEKLIGNRNMIMNILLSIGAILFLIPIFHALSKEAIVGTMHAFSVFDGCIALVSIILMDYAWSRRIIVTTDPLSNWRHDMPYGALLSVKEAKDKGFTDFIIHYPDKIYLADFIITAVNPTGILCEIFFWDDRKVYDVDDSITKE